MTSFPGEAPDIDVARREIERLKVRRGESVTCGVVLVALLPVAEDRSRRVRYQLIEIAAAVECADRPDPVTLARLWLLLGDIPESPLYNPARPAAELDQILHQARWSLAMSE